MKSTIKQAKQSPSKGYPLFKPTVVIILLSLITTVFVGCSETKIVSEGNTAQSTPLSSEEDGRMLLVGYSPDDSLNPYFAKTDLNSDLSSLMYEPLFTISDSFEALPCLAESYSISNNALYVKLTPSAVFSDSAAVSGADVVYSFNKAKNSSFYKSELVSINSATASGNTVIFSLDGNLINPQDCLVFPIVKLGTAENEQSVPVGTGTYKYSKDQDGVKLAVNTNCRNPMPNIRSVKLVALDSSSTLVHTLELGTIDTFFDDLSSGSYSQANAESTSVNLPNLVFLGLNSQSYGLSNASVRQAVYYSVNRQSIVINAFKGCAAESSTPYHPDWHVIGSEEYDISSLSLDYAKAQSLLTEAGFHDKINMTLVVYSGNSFKVSAAEEISKNLSNIGINVTVKQCTWDEYKFALQSGDYDLYIGEIKLPASMDMTALWKTNGSVYGISQSDTTAYSYSEFQAGNISAEVFMASFLQNLPFVPICYRTGVLFCSNEIKTTADCDINNTYKNIYEWSFISS